MNSLTDDARDSDAEPATEQDAREARDAWDAATDDAPGRVEWLRDCEEMHNG
jgi:hypothetical protein